MRATKHAARSAQFDQTFSHRRSMIAKIQIAKKQLGIDDDDYRHQIREVSGQESLKECSERQLARVLDWLKSKGFKPALRKGAASHPMANKARALWISLYHLGAVQNPLEQAFEAFAKRQLGCERLAWARQSDAYRLIEALKAMAVRHGWQQHDRATGKPFQALGLQISLCDAILLKMKEAGIASESWSIQEAAYDLCGIRTPQTAAHYERLAKALGDALRRHTSPVGGLQGIVIIDETYPFLNGGAA
ncbi:MAG: regulatory protein GemA [Sphingomonadales bacterium]|nr:regulatory protein GemA [Sphingomonadales bacterium]MDE2171354.1 regulatory protein GemA [Sphingomonadales bacterium]